MDTIAELSPLPSPLQIQQQIALAKRCLRDNDVHLCLAIYSRDSAAIDTVFLQQRALLLDLEALVIRYHDALASQRLAQQGAVAVAEAEKILEEAGDFS